MASSMGFCMFFFKYSNHYRKYWIWYWMYYFFVFSKSKQGVRELHSLGEGTDAFWSGLQRFFDLI